MRPGTTPFDSVYFVLIALTWAKKSSAKLYMDEGQTQVKKEDVNILHVEDFIHFMKSLMLREYDLSTIIYDYHIWKDVSYDVDIYISDKHGNNNWTIIDSTICIYIYSIALRTSWGIWNTLWRPIEMSSCGRLGAAQAAGIQLQLHLFPFHAYLAVYQMVRLTVCVCVIISSFVCATLECPSSVMDQYWNRTVGDQLLWLPQIVWGNICRLSAMNAKISP